MSEIIKLHCKKLVPGKASGEAIVCNEAVGFYGGIDPHTGMGVEPKHTLEGVCVTGKVLIYPTGKGSSANCNYIYAMSYEHTAPAAFIVVTPDANQIVGALMSKIPAVSCKENPLEVIRTGDQVEVDADNGIITITRA